MSFDEKDDESTKLRHKYVEDYELLLYIRVIQVLNQIFKCLDFAIL